MNYRTLVPGSDKCARRPGAIYTSTVPYTDVALAHCALCTVDWALAVTVRYLLAVRALGVLALGGPRTAHPHAAARRSQDETDRESYHISVNYSI